MGGIPPSPIMTCIACVVDPAVLLTVAEVMASSAIFIFSLAVERCTHYCRVDSSGAGYTKSACVDGKKNPYQVHASRAMLKSITRLCAV